LRASSICLGRRVGAAGRSPRSAPHWRHDAAAELTRLPHSGHSPAISPPAKLEVRSQKLEVRSQKGPPPQPSPRGRAGWGETPTSYFLLPTSYFMNLERSSRAVASACVARAPWSRSVSRSGSCFEVRTERVSP